MKLSALRFLLSGSVIFNEHYKCHHLSMGTDKTSLLYSLSLQLPPLSEKIVKKMVWDPKVGFEIPYGPYTLYNILICNTMVNGRQFKSMYIPTRQSESFVFLAKLAHWKIKSCVDLSISSAFHSQLIFYLHFTALFLDNVKITPERVRLLVGDTLILNCTGETTYNGRINFTWEFPKKRVSSGFTVDTVLLCVTETLTGCSGGVYGTSFVLRKTDIIRTRPKTTLLSFLWWARL